MAKKVFLGAKILKTNLLINIGNPSCQCRCPLHLVGALLCLKLKLAGQYLTGSDPLHRLKTNEEMLRVQPPAKKTTAQKPAAGKTRYSPDLAGPHPPSRPSVVCLEIDGKGGHVKKSADWREDDPTSSPGWKGGWRGGGLERGGVRGLWRRPRPGGRGRSGPSAGPRPACCSRTPTQRRRRKQNTLQERAKTKLYLIHLIFLEDCPTSGIIGIL